MGRTRVPVFLALVIAGAISAYFIATGVVDLLDNWSLNPWAMIGIGLIIGLVLFTFVQRNAAKITVPTILAVAVICIVISVLV